MVGRNFFAALQTHRPAHEFIAWTAEVPSMTALIDEKFGRAARDAYLGSAQSTGRVPRDLIAAVDDIAFPISLLGFVWFSVLALRRQMVEPACLAIITVCGFFGNALLTSAASGVFDRYQARLSWLFLAAGVLVWARLRDAPIRSPQSLRQPMLASWRLGPAMKQASVSAGSPFAELMDHPKRRAPRVTGLKNVDDQGTTKTAEEPRWRP